MFTSFDENKFRQAIKEKDFIRLKTNTVSAILQDPSFAKGEAMQVIEILKKEVPEIFEEEIDLGYEERLEPAQWDKRYFTKLTYWLEENFAISRIAYIEEVGKAITTGSAASTPQTKPAVKKPVERTPIEDMIAPIKEENPVVIEKEPVKVSVQEEKVPVVTTGAGSPGKYMKEWKAAGVTVIPVVPSVAMAKMNMYIHEISDAKIAWGDTLANPMFKDEDGNLLTFDAIVANMPFSKDKWAAGFNPGGEAVGKGKKEFKMEAALDKYHRFDRGVPPSSKGDWAFLLHMLASASVNGRIAAVAPHGVLFRGAAEGRIRQRVIEENLLDAVIGLPENLFYGTSIPACILVFKKDRSENNVLFIDASGKDENGNLRYRKDKRQNVLEEKNVSDIVDAYFARKDIDKFSRVATIDEIKENGYNLNIPRYVDTFEEEELIDIDEVQSNIARLKGEIAEAEKQLEEYLRELGL